MIQSGTFKFNNTSRKPVLSPEFNFTQMQFFEPMEEMNTVRTISSPYDVKINNQDTDRKNSNQVSISDQQSQTAKTLTFDLDNNPEADSLTTQRYNTTL